MTENQSKITYQSAGVDIEAGDRAAELMKKSVKQTHFGHTTFSGGGGFAGMYDISSNIISGSLKKPILATSTDGVGTKVSIAQKMGIHNTVGFDLVGMVVDDIAVTGAKPLFMTDYICVGKVVPETVSKIVEGISAACVEAKTALIGGETAEHPGLLKEDEYDIAGAATGIVDADEILEPENVKSGDLLIALASSGLHSNGFSLVRAVCASQFPSKNAGVENAKNFAVDYETNLPEFSNKSLGEVLLEPTKIYSTICQNLIAKFRGDLKMFSHITGGGIASNLSRVLPQGLTGIVQKSSWEIPLIFNLIQSWGSVPFADLEKTLNLGIGMIAVVSPEKADEFVSECRKEGVDSWVCGEVIETKNVSQFSISETDLISGTKGLSNSGAAVLV